MTDRGESSTRAVGSEYETKAAAYLIDLGWRILERNFRTSYGEIDLIGMDGFTLVFVEVKYRRRTRYGTPEMAVNRKKQQTIYRTAQMYLKAHGYSERQNCRFDVLAIQGDHIEHFKDAFGGM